MLHEEDNRVPLLSPLEMTPKKKDVRSSLSALYSSIEVLEECEDVNVRMPSSTVPTSKYEWWIDFTSTLLFILGSVMYLFCAISDFQWRGKLLDVPEWLRGIDDDISWTKYRSEQNNNEDDDDSLFQVGSYNVWVSKYQIIYFFGALSFVLTGIIDMWQEKAPFHALMILAGVFGVVSAFFVEEDEFLSDILDCISVHLFFLEGASMFVRDRYVYEQGEWANWISCTADAEFVLGSILDVLVSMIVPM